MVVVPPVVTISISKGPVHQWHWDVWHPACHWCTRAALHRRVLAPSLVAASRGEPSCGRDQAPAVRGLVVLVSFVFKILFGLENKFLLEDFSM